MIHATSQTRHKAHTEEVVARNIQRGQTQIRWLGPGRIHVARAVLLIGDMPVSHQKSTLRRSASM